MRTRERAASGAHLLQDNDAEEDPLYRAFHLGSRQLANVDDYVEMEVYFDQCLVWKRAAENGQEKNRGVEASLPSCISWDDLKAIRTERLCATQEEFLFYKAAQVAHHARNFFSEYMFTSQLPVFEVVFGSTDTASPPHLRTRCRVGDNLEEEWLMAAWALQLTKEMTNVSIAIRDADGDFMLVEAAMRLPAWLSPSTAQNRVFLRQGVLQIIPISITGSFNTSFSLQAQQQSKAPRTTQRSEPSLLDESGPASLLLLDALKVLKTDQLRRCVAPPAVQKVIMQRIHSLYPIVSAWKLIERCPSPLAFRCAKDTVCDSKSQCDSAPHTPTCTSFTATASLCLPHHFRICVPVPVAVLLLRFPHLTSVALDRIPPTPDVTRKIQAFFNYNSDTKSSAVGGAIKPRSLVFDCQSNPNIPTVFIRIALNHCQYGRLRYLRFKPPARFTRTRWILPNQAEGTKKQAGNEGSNPSSQSSGSEHANCDDPNLRQAADFGAKICLGLLVSYIEGLTRWDDHAASAIFWSFHDPSLTHTKNPQAAVQNYWSAIDDFYGLINRACQPLSEKTPLVQAAKFDDSTSVRHSLWAQVANQLNLAAGFEETPDSNEGVYAKAPLFRLPVFSRLLESAYEKAAEAIEQQKESDPDDLNFFNSLSTNVSRVSHSPSAREGNKPVLGIRFCRCQMTVRDDLGCAGRYCLKPDETDSWLALSPEEVDALVQERTLDERCCKWIQQKQAQLQAASDGLPTRGNTETLKRPNPSHGNESNADEAQVVQELDSLLKQFKTLLNNCSGYEGVDYIGSTAYDPDKTNEFWKRKEELRGSVPQEFKNIFNELYDAQNMMDESESLSVSEDEGETKALHDQAKNYPKPYDRHLSDASKSSEVSSSFSDASSSDLEDGQDYFAESNANGGDRHMHALLRAMDDELSQHMTEIKKPFMHDVALADHPGTQQFEAETIPFRAMNPSVMTDIDLEDQLQSSLDESRKEENFLEPGPATILLKCLDDFNVRKA